MLPLLRLAGRHSSLAGLGHGVHLHPAVHHIRSGGRSLEADPHTVVDISLAVVETDDHVVTGRELLFVHLELDGIGIEGDGRILHVQHHTVQFAGASGPVFAIEDRNGNDLLSLADDQEIGRIAVVIQEVDPVKNTGRVRLDGVDWIAVSQDGTIIPENTSVRIEAVSGTKLTVSRLPETVTAGTAQ